LILPQPIGDDGHEKKPVLLSLSYWPTLTCPCLAGTILKQGISFTEKEIISPIYFTTDVACALRMSGYDKLVVETFDACCPTGFEELTISV
jgi:hypothetical protein